MRVLIVEDDAETRALLVRALAKDAHVTHAVEGVAGADESVRARAFDVVVLDLGLPDGSGVMWCNSLRRNGFDVPVVVLTAQGAVSSRLACFDAGADDFLAKPFAVAELRARVRALGRRGPLPRGLVRRVGAATLDVTARRAWRDEVEVPVTAREWAVLELLAVRDGRVVSRGEILEVVWDDDSARAAASLDVIVARIRKKLGDAVLRTVRGEGYALGGG